MKFTLTFILSVLHFTSFCQITAKDIERRDTAVGKKTDGTSLNGTKYKFQHSILEYYNDSANSRLILILHEKNKRHIVSLNTDDLSINWSKKTNSKNFFFTPNTIIEQTKDNSKCYDPKNGELMWERKPPFVIFDQIMEIGITATGSGYNLRTGNEIWMRNLDYTTGLQSVTKTDDSSLFLITTQALHRVNTITSKGWKYNVLPINAAYNRGNTIVIATGPAAGLIGSLAASALMAAYEKNQERKHSLKLANAISEGLKTYIVSDKKLACMNAENLEWEVDLPKDLIAPFSAVSANDNIWITGRSRIKSKRTLYTSRVLIYSKSDGNLVNEFQEKDTSLITDVMPMDNKIYVAFEKKIKTIDIGTSNVIAEVSLATGNDYKFFEPESYYRENSGNYIELRDKYPTDIFLSSDTNTIFRYDADIRLQDSIIMDELYIASTRHEDYKFVHATQQPEQQILLYKGEKKAVLYGRFFFAGNQQIVCIKDNTIQTIRRNKITD